MKKFLEGLTIDPLSYVSLSMRKLDCNIFNISSEAKKEIMENLTFYIIDSLVSNGYGITQGQAKQLSKGYLWQYEQRENKYLKS